MLQQSADADDSSARLSDVLDLLAVVTAVGLLVLAYQGATSLPRTLLTLGFACFVPGRAVVTNWPLLGRWSEAAMSLLVSLVLVILLAMTTLWARYWHPLGLLQAEAAASVAAIAFGAFRRRGRRPRAAAPEPAPGLAEASGEGWRFHQGQAGPHGW